MKRPLLLALMALLLLCQACNTNTVYDHFVQLEQGVWTWQDALQFEAEIGDTLSMHDIYLQVRHTTDYPLSNLYMFVHIESPTGQHLKDTVNLIMAAPDGRWIGRGNGNIRELMLLFRQQSIFAVPGTYVFTLEQAMREEELPVSDVGIRIERSNP